MRNPALLLLAATLLAGRPAALAAAPEPADAAARAEKARTLASFLNYQRGVVVLGGAVARVTLPESFRYLSPADTDTVLTSIWGNPGGQHTLGMIVPAGFDPLRAGSWVAVLSYADDGYVRDDDAGKIDYPSLLRKMKDATAEENSRREKEGYPSVDLVGWAAPPRYDASTHKLYWAKDVRFAGAPGDTLNYNIRMLGRSGVLVLNVVAPIGSLGEIEAAAPTLLSMVDFEPGHRYTDFRQGTDKVATYGIAALVAGGIAAKVGLLKGLWVGVLALKKFIILGALALSRYARRLWDRLRGRPRTPAGQAPPEAPPAPPSGTG